MHPGTSLCYTPLFDNFSVNLWRALSISVPLVVSLPVSTIWHHPLCLQWHTEGKDLWQVCKFQTDWPVVLPSHQLQNDGYIRKICDWKATFVNFTGMIYADWADFTCNSSFITPLSSQNIQISLQLTYIFPKLVLILPQTPFLTNRKYSWQLEQDSVHQR